jgi:hypothetical protein
MAGLDPAISFRAADARIKAAHDGLTNAQQNILCAYFTR